MNTKSNNRWTPSTDYLMSKSYRTYIVRYNVKSISSYSYKNATEITMARGRRTNTVGLLDEAPTQDRPSNLKITSASLSRPIVRARSICARYACSRLNYENIFAFVLVQHRVLTRTRVHQYDEYGWPQRLVSAAGEIRNTARPCALLQ